VKEEDMRKLAVVAVARPMLVGVSAAVVVAGRMPSSSSRSGSRAPIDRLCHEL
jgi:hypothetical protein